VRAFGQEEQQNLHFDTVNQNLRDAEINVMKAHIRYEVPYNLGRVIPNLLVWVTGAFLIIYRQGTLEYGQLLTFISYLAMMQGPMQFFSMIFVIWSESMNAAQRMFEIIDARPDIVEKENPLDADLGGAIELRHVSFGYEVNKPILKEIDFRVQAGEMLGIVGKSGAGKSTLVNLIARLYDVSEGQILLDGHDVRDLSFKSLHGAVAMVSQETYIFMGTIAENIAYARPAAARQAIVDAAIAAHAHQFICKLPDGYDTLVGTGGRQLSGGERQRLSIARAILADPKILVLDEATASVDTETERAIQASLNELVKGRTTLSIAHRLSTLKGADRIIVLENGRLAEAGTHQELIARRGAYFNLMELQTKALAMRGID
jgi:ATP-binding cassette subfamily B protein